MRRREFITLVGGAAAWPVVASAQQTERMRRVGLLSGLAADGSDQLGQIIVATFSQALQQLGWIDGRNVRIDHRSIGGNAEDARKSASELVALGPDVLVATGGAVLALCFKRPEASRSCSQMSPIQSARALSKVFHARVATPQVFCSSNIA
jgi:putative tryptophan/tyrosine transport system substrate-binding protein